MSEFLHGIDWFGKALPSAQLAELPAGRLEITPPN